MAIELDPKIKGAIPELTALPLFDGLSEPEVKALVQGASIRLNEHRGHLFVAGEKAGFFGVVLNGAYKLSRLNPAGEETIIHFCAPGDVLAAFIMTQSQPVYPLTATSMGPSRFLAVPKENYSISWKKYPELIFRIQQLLSSRMTLLHDQKAMSRAPLPSKVAALLLSLVAQAKNEPSYNVPIPLTRKEIADSLGTTVESVIRVMSEWSKKEYVTTSDHRITILKPSKIIELMQP